MSDWRPIESAPTDGTVVLLYNPQWAGGMTAMRGYSLHGEWHSEEKIMTLGRNIDIEDPTHWQPLSKSNDSDAMK